MPLLRQLNNWLRPYLTNAWMASPDFTAQMAHVFFAAFAILATSMLGHSPLTTAAILLVATAIKEFWYDLEFELPKQTLAGSSLDFFAYQAGSGLGLLVLYLTP